MLQAKGETCFMEAGDKKKGGGQRWGVNEALTESYLLERFWHAEVAVAAYTAALQ